MSQVKQQQKFFSTQIPQKQNQQQVSPKKQQSQQQQHLQLDPIQQKPIFPQPIIQNNLKQLLQKFNSFDKHQKGLISLQQCQLILKSCQLSTDQNSQQIQLFHNLSLPQVGNKCTFDQFLFVFGMCQNRVTNLTIQLQYQYCRTTDQRIVDFMKLLNNYRKKCQKQSSYSQAKKSKTKVQEIRQKQYQRRKNYLTILHNKEMQDLQTQQKQKFIQFCKTWDQFMNQYEQTAIQLVKKLNQKHQSQINQYGIKVSDQLNSKVHYSKQIIQLQSLQKTLVKAQQYQKAQKIQSQIQFLKQSQLQKKQQLNNQKVLSKVQTLKKQQSTSLNTLLQKIQKDRNQQIKQKNNDYQRLMVKNKNLLHDIKHKHQQLLKKVYDTLHNVSLEDTPKTIVTNEKTKPLYTQTLIKQRNK